VYLGATDAPPLLVLAAAEGTGADAGALIKTLAAELGGRGGGSPRMAQLTLPEPAAVGRAVDLILERLA
jgi:alanyl-tRNA synthetase